MDVVNLAEKLTRFSEHWTPKIVAEIDDYEIKVAKLAGEFVWHKHDEADELFLVLAGDLDIAFRDRSVSLRPGELLVVPRGVEHRPSARAECHVLLMERRGVVNTGDAGGDLTVADPERI